MCAMFPDGPAPRSAFNVFEAPPPAVTTSCAGRDRPDLTSEMLTEGCGAVQETVTRKETETKLNLYHLAQVLKLTK